ncbi:MAG TPA: ABC transporter permease [Methylomirabilota bacterium]|jgi:peptide/nickel transport system permease protein|nr:ABC transporter permease [Methylomirabilota bacterium]
MSVPVVIAAPAPDVRTLTPEQERYYLASQWQLIWWRLQKHRLAMAALWFLVAFYAIIPFVEFLAPYALRTRHADYVYFPPQRVHVFHDGRLVGPFVYGHVMTINMETLKREYREDFTRRYRVRLLAEGEPYAFLGLWQARVHLFGSEEGGTLFLLGTDRLGRDMLSRILHGARISLTVGLVGISVSFVLALIFGGLSGYYGGKVDIVIQRLIEVIRSFPELPLWMALSAALPARLEPILVYVGITIILGIIDWTGLARSIRGKLLSLREEDFATAALLMGGSPAYVIRRHLLPAFTSHLIVSATLSIPRMILGETALSFLGLGLRSPITSWGVLLTEAQNMNAVALYPWLMAPVVAVVLTVLAFNFLGDGLRDAADPYA